MEKLLIIFLCLFIPFSVYGAIKKIESPKWLKWLNEHFNLLRKV